MAKNKDNSKSSKENSGGSDWGSINDSSLSFGTDMFGKFQEQMLEWTKFSQGNMPLAGSLQSMYGDNWLQNFYLNPMDPNRLQAMADAGKFMQEAREIAGLSLSEFSDAVGLNSEKVEAIEQGKSPISMEAIFRSASLLARHDPLPFVLKFMRTFNPAMESVLKQWGLDVFPKHLERERHFLNLYRSKDALRHLTDDEFTRLVRYMNSAMDLVIDVMESEKNLKTDEE